MVRAGDGVPSPQATYFAEIVHLVVVASFDMDDFLMVALAGVRTVADMVG